MIRQRIHLRRIGVGEIVLRLLVSLLAVAAIFYGAIVVLAALKVSPHSLQSVSAYHTIQARLESITAHDITVRDRIIVAVAGVASLLVFGPIAWRALPRPYLARGAVDLDEPGGRGWTELAPRAVERSAEIAADRDDAVAGASARYDTDTVEVRIDLADGADLLDTLRGAQSRVRESLIRDGMAHPRVDVTVAGLARTITKETSP